MPISNYLPRARIVEPTLLRRVLESAEHPCALSVLEAVLASEVSTAERRLATLAWMLKYDLLRVALLPS